MRINAALAKQCFQPERTSFIGNDGYDEFSERSIPEQLGDESRECHGCGRFASAGPFEEFLEYFRTGRLHGCGVDRSLRDETTQLLAPVQQVLNIGRIGCWAIK